MSVNINLYSDWIDAVRDELSQNGHAVAGQSEEELAHAFLNLQKRLVQPLPRHVLKANGFSCPAAQAAGLAKLEDAIRRGDDLYPYLSRLIKRPDYNDALLNHWGIHHLHLGEVIEQDGFIKRTGPVLYVRFDRENAYLITVADHGQWSVQDHVRVIHRNWPQSISPYKYAGHVVLAKQIEDEDVATLRKVNINTSVEVEPGVVYGPIGGGYASSGISIDVVRQSDYVRERLGNMTQAVLSNIDSIRAHALENGVVIPESPTFKLEIADGTAYALEESARYLVKLGSL